MPAGDVSGPPSCAHPPLSARLPQGGPWCVSRGDIIPRSWDIGNVDLLGALPQLPISCRPAASCPDSCPRGPRVKIWTAICLKSAVSTDLYIIGYRHARSSAALRPVLPPGEGLGCLCPSHRPVCLSIHGPTFSEILLRFSGSWHLLPASAFLCLVCGRWLSCK